MLRGLTAKVSVSLSELADMIAETAMSKIKNGSRVFIGTGCGEPQHLIRTMVEDMSMQDIMVYQMLSSTFSTYVEDPRFLRRFSLKLFFISSSMRKAAFEGKIDYIPTCPRSRGISPITASDWMWP